MTQEERQTIAESILELQNAVFNIAEALCFQQPIDAAFCTKMLSDLFKSYSKLSDVLVINQQDISSGDR